MPDGFYYFLEYLMFLRSGLGAQYSSGIRSICSLIRSYRSLGRCIRMLVDLLERQVTSVGIEVR